MKDIERLTNILNGNFILPQTQTIGILGEKWKIKVKKDLKNKDGQSVYGLCSHPDRLITIDDASDVHTLFHEIVHTKDRFLLIPNIESRVNTEAYLWSQVFAQINPISRLWKKLSKNYEVIKKSEIKRLKNKIKRLEKK